MTTISLKLPEGLLKLVEEESRLRGRSKSFVVREALEKSLGKENSGGSCYDLSRDLAGSAKRLPKDLATNPKYMKGFGQ